MNRGADAPCTDVGAIVVSYEPDMARLTTVIDAVVGQVGRLLLVDNSETVELQQAVSALADQYPSASLLAMGGNKGLSAAYNAGIVELRSHAELSQVLLLDQDSLVAADMVRALRGALQVAARDDRLELMTVGPWYRDELSGRRSVVLRSARYSMARERICADSCQSPVLTEMLISSGSLIPFAAFDRLGMLDADLFIDHIDTDWSLRVRAAGLSMAVVPQAEMSHQLGDRVQSVWWGRARTLPVHAPRRLYFIFRNSLWLYVRPHAHWRWVLFDMKRLLAVAGVHMLAAGPRLERLRMIGRGLLHGIAPGLTRRGVVAENG